MRDGGRLQAAIEVLADMEAHHRPAQDALRDWGKAHRFAGSGDRAMIGNLVFDALRHRPSLAYKMGEETPRALVLGVYGLLWGKTSDAIIALFAEDKHAPDPLTDDEIAALTADRDLAEADLHVQADLPAWIMPYFDEAFGEDAIAEARALAARAPLDLRANTLKAGQAKVLKALSHYNAKPANLAHHGVRITMKPGASRLPNVQSDTGYQKGWFEVQDEGSQVVSVLINAQPGEKVLDLCAGGGGKTLALAAQMENKGQIFAYDVDKHRLAPIHERLKRAGTRNVQVREPKEGALDDLIGRMDKVVLDAPCTGSGTWRRKPDAKWRLSEEQLHKRMEEQAEVLTVGRDFVKPGGYLIYITCSVFPQENEQRVYEFVENNPDFELVSAGEVWQDQFGYDKPQPWSSDMMTVTMTPASTGTDGFFFAVIERRGEGE